MKHNYRRVYDPLYGVIELSSKEYSIIMSPEIQRLRYVRMCNINSLLVTGASEISRFEHIIGVLHLAKEWTNTHDSLLNIKQKEEIHAAALLHDFQTGPFGHSLQYIFEDNESDDDFIHDDISHGTNLKFHQTTDANRTFSGRPFICETLLGDSWTNVAALIKGEGEFGQIISGTIDLDNIDNVIRLAYHVGIAKSSDSNIALELARDIKPTSSGLEISQSSIDLIKEWQAIRRRLYELLLLDWAEFSSKAMLTKALELSVDFNLLGTESWLLTDLELFNSLEKASTGDAQEVGDLIKRIRCGDLYIPIFLGTSSSIKTYNTFSSTSSKRELEKRLTHEIGEKVKEKVNIIIHPILDVKKTDRSIDVVIRENGAKMTIGSDSKQLLIGVFVSKNIESDEKFNKSKKVNKLNNIKNIVIEFLQDSGLDELKPIKDPMLASENVQMDLL